MNEIDNWIYDKQYLDDSLISIKKGKKQSLLYDIASSARFSASLKKGKMLSFNDLEADDVFGIIRSRFYTSFRGLPQSEIGWNNLKEDLEKIYVQVVEWHEEIARNRYEEPGTRRADLTYDRIDADTYQKLYYYQKTLNAIYKFMVKNNLDFLSPTVKDVKLIEAINNDQELIMNSYDLQYWKDGIEKSYIKVFQLSKYLGIDPLTFRINPDNSPFDPHHFRALEFRQMSSHTQDLIVTSKRFHRKYEVLQNTLGWRGAEVYVETLIKCLEELLTLKDSSGSLRKIKDSDVRQVLQKNFGSDWKSVYNGWVSEFTQGMDGIDNYKDALDKINERRLKYMPGNPDGYAYKDFLLKEYKVVFYNDYWKNLKGRPVISRIIASQKDIDYFNILFKGFSKARLI